MIAYKLFTLRKDGSLGPLFINRRQRLQVGETYEAENHPTKGYVVRPGWHCCHSQYAPHLSEKGRVWCKVSISDWRKHVRPESQGGIWYTANRLKILSVL
jgi:hypothetical protein